MDLYLLIDPWPFLKPRKLEVITVNWIRCHSFHSITHCELALLSLNPDLHEYFGARIFIFFLRHCRINAFQCDNRSEEKVFLTLRRVVITSCPAWPASVESAKLNWNHYKLLIWTYLLRTFNRIFFWKSVNSISFPAFCEHFVRPLCTMKLFRWHRFLIATLMLLRD